MSGLTAEEQETFLEVLRDVEYTGAQTGTWEQGKVFAAVERIVAEREQAAEVRALRAAADELGGRVTTPVGSPGRIGDWLRDRADRIERDVDATTEGDE
jgi:hypothetical protein